MKETSVLACWQIFFPPLKAIQTVFLFLNHLKQEYKGFQNELGLQGW